MNRLIENISSSALALSDLALPKNYIALFNAGSTLFGPFWFLFGPVSSHNYGILVVKISRLLQFDDRLIVAPMVLNVGKRGKLSIRWLRLFMFFSVLSFPVWLLRRCLFLIRSVILIDDRLFFEIAPCLFEAWRI